MDRKLCSDCGNSSLASETTCWACGGSRFTPMASPALGDQTMDLGSRFDRTMSWRAAPQNAQLWWGLAAAFGMALFMCIIGYWVGRASTPAPAAAVPAASNPVTLPTPPTALTFTPTTAAPAPSATMTPASAPVDTAQVTVHTRPIPGGDPGRRTASNIAPYPAGLATPMTPGPVATQRPMASTIRAAAPHPTFQVTTSRRITDTITAPEAAPLGPGAGVPAVSGNEGGAVVMVRNDAATSVTLRLDGPSSRMVIVGAGSTVPLNLAAGSYRISADSNSAASTRSTLAVSASGSYSLVVSSHPDGGREVLSLIEPALGG